MFQANFAAATLSRTARLSATALTSELEATLASGRTLTPSTSLWSSSTSWPSNGSGSGNASSPLECREKVRDSVPLEVLVISGMLLAFSLTGTAGNVLVLLVYSRARPAGGVGGGSAAAAQQTSTVFILSMALADLLASALNMPLTVAYELNAYHFGVVLCHVYHLLLSAIQQFSTHLMVAIAVDRYLCICHPFARLLTVPRAKLLVLCIALETFLESLLVTSSFEVKDKEELVPREREPEPEAPTAAALPGPIAQSAFAISNALPFDRGAGSQLHSPSPPTDDAAPSLAAQQMMTQECVVDRGVCEEKLASFVPLKLLTRLHVSSFVISVLIASVLYTLIYISVLKQRAKKRRMKSGTLYKEAGSQSSTRLQAHVNGSHRFNSANRASLQAETLQLKQLASRRKRTNGGAADAADAKNGANEKYMTAPESSTSDSGTGAGTGEPLSGSAPALQALDSGCGNAATQQQNCETAKQQATATGNESSGWPKNAESKSMRTSSNGSGLLSQLTAPAARRSVSRESAGLISPRGRALAMSAEASARLQNMRIALMLFVVTISFVVLYTSGTLFNSGLIDAEKLPFSGVLYYTYFAMNVCNPLIYCFMNNNFRVECAAFFRCNGSLRFR